MAEETKIEVKGGRLRTTLQIASATMLGILTFLLGYAVLWADKHNDERYVKQADYRRDREADDKLRAAVQQTITYRMDQSDKKLEEISRDIKALLSRPAYQQPDSANPNHRNL